MPDDELDAAVDDLMARARGSLRRGGGQAAFYAQIDLDRAGVPYVAGDGHRRHVADGQEGIRSLIEKRHANFTQPPQAGVVDL